MKLNVYSAVKEYTRRLIGNPSLNPSDGIDASLPLSSCHASSSAQPKGVALLPEIFSEVLTTLIRLLSFLNEILIEEWSPDHQKLKHLPADSAHELHSCDFCGADIFQSFFACSKCSDSDYGSEFICCSGCYVEGRSCICGPASMEPYQRWRFDDLVLELNVAANIINKYQVPGDRIPQINSKAIESSSHLKTFYAACILRDRVLRQTSVCLLIVFPSRFELTLTNRIALQVRNAQCALNLRLRTALDHHFSCNVAFATLACASRISWKYIICMWPKHCLRQCVTQTMLLGT